jgi:hypothetical protein
MHSMVGAFAPYTVKRRRVELVRGYCYRFIQCSFPCGIIMLILSILFLTIGISQLIYIFSFNGCTTLPITNDESTTTDISSISISSSSFKCNRQTMKVLGITFVVTGSVLLVISLLVTKYSRTGEENNVIRTTTSSLLTTNKKKNSAQQKQQQQQHHPLSSHHHHNDQNHVIVSIR